jgi:hypothetical protein
MYGVFMNSLNSKKAGFVSFVSYQLLIFSAFVLLYGVAGGG